jgi:hypothetical protein
MANPEHLDILKSGVGIWNQWRRKNPHIRPDLSWTVLIGLIPEVNLFRGVDFSEANLEGAVLSGADLTGATFTDANLACAKLCRILGAQADFTGANLAKVELTPIDEPSHEEAEPPQPKFIDADLATSTRITTPDDEEEGRVSIAVAWDPEIASQSDYADLIVALGDLVRSEGGLGVRRRVEKLFGVNIGTGVLA